MVADFVQSDKGLRRDKKDTEPQIEKSIEAPFSFGYIEHQLRKKHFGILSTISPEGKPHSVGVVYEVSPPTDDDHHPFCLYLITRPVLKKARNIRNNPNVSFVVPFPHYVFRMLLLLAFSSKEKPNSYQLMILRLRKRFRNRLY